MPKNISRRIMREKTNCRARFTSEKSKFIPTAVNRMDQLSDFLIKKVGKLLKVNLFLFR